MPTENPQQENPRPERRAQRFPRWAHALHTFLHFLWSILIVAALAMVYLWVFGLPEGPTNHFIDRLQTAEFRVEARRLRLDPLGGAVLDDVRLSGPAPLGTNFTAVAHLRLALEPRKLLDGEVVIREVQASDGRLAWPYLFQDGTPRTAIVEAVQADVVLATNLPTRIRVQGRAGRLFVDISGEIARGRGGEEQRSPWVWLKTLSERSRDIPPGLQLLQKEMQSARFGQAPVAKALFTYDSERPERNEVRVSVEGQRTFFRGGVLDRWALEGVYGDENLILTNLVMVSARGLLRATGRIDFRNRLVSGHVASDLPSGHALRMVPDPVAEWLRRRQIRVLGNLSADLRLDPAPFATAWTRVRGTVAFDQTEYHDLWIQSATATFAREGAELRVNGISAVIGRNAGQGPLTGDWSLDLETGACRTDVVVGFDPAEARSIMTRAQTTAVDLFTFPSLPPRITCRAERGPGPQGEWTATGAVSARELTFRGVPVEQFACSYTYGHERLAMQDWDLQRPEGSIRGSLTLNFANHLHEVDLDSTADPNAVKKIVGTGFEKNLSIARFKGPAHIVASGVVDSDQGAHTDLRVMIEGEQLGVSWFTADKARLDLHALGRRLAFTNVQAYAYGGTLSGRFILFPDGETEHFRYEVSGSADRMDLALVLQHVRDEATNTMKGTLNGSVTLTGLVGEGQGKSAVGTGAVAIVQGELFKVPVLGALSRLLSAVVPGLGFASQTDFRSDFRIERGRAITKEAMLMGSLISIRAEGAYYFDQRLKFVVEIKPLRKGDLAALLRFVTSPVTKLFELNLTGTLKEPKWRPNNIPKEVFLIFD
jgi:hypothetical protein